MKTLPILFDTEMVRALRGRRKSVTRRVVNFPEGFNPNWTGYVADGSVLYGSNNIPVAKCLYIPGDILYVRETWAESIEGYAYKADFDDPDGWGWRPSIHMPKEAARIFLRVTDVRVEKLQDSFSAPISPIFELLAEGMDIGDDCRECIDTYGEPCCVDTVDEDGSNLYGGECGLLDEVRSRYSELWDSLYAKPMPVKENGVVVRYESYPWADIRETRTYRGKPWIVIGNPWVWVISFERVDKPEGWTGVE